MSDNTNATFSLITTFLAAFAAIMSAVAAFSQERATFTSTLYSKQVDAIGAFLQQSGTYLQSNQDLEWDLNAFLAPHGSGDITALEDKIRKNAAQGESVGETYRQLNLVLPNDFREQADHINGFIWRTTIFPSQMWQRCFDKTKQQSVCSYADLNKLNEPLNSLIYTYDRDIKFFETCAYLNLSQGKFLTEGMVKSCKNAGVGSAH